jgi:hypothetical protein
LTPGDARYFMGALPPNVRAKIDQEYGADSPGRVVVSFHGTMVDAAHTLPALMGLDLRQLRRRRARGLPTPTLKGLIDRGEVEYSNEDPAEWWQTADDAFGMIDRGDIAILDCEDLASWGAADLRFTGADPGAYPIVYRAAPHLGHVIIRSPRYGLLDPSRAAGM